MKDTTPKRRTLDERMATAGLPVLKSTSHECIQLYVMNRIKDACGGLIHSDGEWWQVGPLGAWVKFDDNLIWKEVRALDGVETMEGRTDTKAGKAIRVNSGLCESVCSLAASEFEERHAFVDPSAADGIPRTVGFITPAGLWSCNSSEGWSTRKPVPDDRVRLWYGKDPDMNTPPKRWLAFLKRIWGNETVEEFDARCDFIHEWMVSMFMGNVTLQAVAPILVGEGKNGKSQLINVIKGLVPPELRCSVTPDRLENNNFASSSLVGKALNMVAEVPGGELLSSNRIKAIIDGSEQECERKHRDSFQFKPTCGHIFGCNALPKVHDFTEGFWRRWAPLTFSGAAISDSEKISGYAQVMLDEEGPAILGHAMNAYANMVANSGSFTIPPGRAQAIRNWRADSDTTMAWLEECARSVHKEANGTDASITKPWTNVRDLYSNYKGWCRETGFKMPVAMNTFGQRLAQLGFIGEREDGASKRPLWIIASAKEFGEKEEQRNSLRVMR